MYDSVETSLPLGLPFTPTTMNAGWPEWASLPDLFPASFQGVKTSRDRFLVDMDLDKLKARVKDYFDSPTSTRPGPDEAGFISYAYRPFETRWLYWEAKGELFDRPRPDYKTHVFDRNLWMVTQQKPRRECSLPQIIASLGCLDLMDRGATCIPAWLRDESLALDGNGAQQRPNLSDVAQCYLDRGGVGVEDLFHHVLAVLHDPAYRKVNAGALRMEWPRIPLPSSPDGDAPEAAEELTASSSVPTLRTTAPTGATSPQPSGAINSAATRSSKSGSPTGSTAFWAGL